MIIAHNSIEIEGLVSGNFKADDAEDVLEDIQKVRRFVDAANIYRSIHFFANRTFSRPQNIFDYVPPKRACCYKIRSFPGSVKILGFRKIWVKSP